MNKLILSFTLYALISCQGSKNTNLITATTKGFTNGTKVFVNTMSPSNRPIIIDSTIIKDNKFSVEISPSTNRDFNFITFEKIKGNLLFINESHPIKMTIYKDSIQSSVIEGGAENTLFTEYVNTIKKLNKKISDLNNQNRIAIRNGNREKVKELNEQLKSLRKDEGTIRESYASKHPNSLISVMALSDLARMNTLKINDLKNLHAQVNDSLKSTRLGKNLQLLINNRIVESSRKKIDVGNVAEDFEAPTPEGKMLSLKKCYG